MVVGTDFFIQVLKNSNQATMRNEVRQNANRILQDIVFEIRRSQSATFAVGSLATPTTLTINYIDGSQTVYSDDNNTGILTKRVGGVNTILTSNSVAVLDCPSSCGVSCNVGGLYVIPSSISPTVPAMVKIVVQQNPAKFATSDFCASYAATDSAIPRRY